MAKILILNIPMHGHVNPTIALTKELVERGHDVTYLINEEFRKIIAPTGANIITYEAQAGKKLKVSNTFTIMSTIYHKAIEIGGDFDCLIYEMGFFFGAKLGEELGIKTVCLTSTFAFNDKIVDDFIKDKGFLRNIIKTKVFRKVLSRLLIKDKNLRDTDLMYELINHNPGLNIVYTSRQFQINQEDFDEKQFVFIGPSVGGRLQESDIPFDKMKERIIYISLGTISSSLDFFKTCIEAFKDTNVSVIMSIGKQVTIEELGAVPNNFYIYPFVPQVAVLQHTDLFITHCGMNSANEAMYYGVPVIGVPQRADQPFVANRMRELGLGEVIDKKHVTAAKLSATANKILNDSTYQANMARMLQEMLSAGGYSKAADEIERYMHEEDFARNHALCSNYTG